MADHVSGGRVELGLGAGWNEREHAAFGFPFPPLGERMQMLAEQLEIVHGQWTSEPFSFAGEHYAVDAVDAQPRPVQSPHPPLLMGGQAGPRAAALAARWADEYNAVLAPFDEVIARKERIEAACEAAGREPIPVSLMTAVLVGRDRAEYEERRRLLSERVGAEPGEVWLTGTVDEVAEQLGALRDAGIARVMCQQLLHDDLDMVALIGERAGAAGGLARERVGDRVERGLVLGLAHGDDELAAADVEREERAALALDGDGLAQERSVDGVVEGHGQSSRRALRERGVAGERAVAVALGREPAGVEAALADHGLRARTIAEPACSWTRCVGWISTSVEVGLASATGTQRG